MKFLVDVKEIYASSIVVEADSAEEAEKIAMTLCITDDPEMIHEGLRFECESDPLDEREE